MTEPLTPIDEQNTTKETISIGDAIFASRLTADIITEHNINMPPYSIHYIKNADAIAVNPSPRRITLSGNKDFHRRGFILKPRNSTFSGEYFYHILKYNENLIRSELDLRDFLNSERVPTKTLLQQHKAVHLFNNSAELIELHKSVLDIHLQLHKGYIQAVAYDHPIDILAKKETPVPIAKPSRK